MPADRDYSPYQKKVIGRYYEHRPTILLQRLADLVANLYLAEGKGQDKLWKQAEEAMQKLGVPAPRVEHVLAKRDPAILAVLVKEWDAK